MADEPTRTYEERFGDFLPGIDLSQPAAELRYQLLAGSLHTLQLMPDGSVVRGQLDPGQVSFPTPEEGWYDWDGTFLGDDAQLPQ